MIAVLVVAERPSLNLMETMRAKQVHNIVGFSFQTTSSDCSGQGSTENSHECPRGFQSNAEITAFEVKGFLSTSKKRFFSPLLSFSSSFSHLSLLKTSNTPQKVNHFSLDSDSKPRDGRGTPCETKPQRVQANWQYTSPKNNNKKKRWKCHRRRRTNGKMNLRQHSNEEKRKLWKAVCTHCPVDTSNTRTVSSSLPLQILLPSLLHDTACTVEECPSSVRMQCPLDASHSRTVLSSLALQILLPSLLHDTAVTYEECPSSVWMHFPLDTSHTRIVLSSLPLQILLPSLLHDTTIVDCPSSVRMHSPLDTSHTRTVLSSLALQILLPSLLHDTA